MRTRRRPFARLRAGGLAGVGLSLSLGLVISGCTTAAPQAAPTVLDSTGPTTTAPMTTTPTTPGPTRTNAGPQPASQPSPTARPQPAPVVLLRHGDSSARVRELQARLKQLHWYDGDVTNYYGTRTTDAVRGFQAKRGFAATGALDEHTWSRVVSMSRRPTQDELNNIEPKPVASTPSKLSWDVDQRCLTGRVICISKSTRMLTWVIDGVPQYQFDIRFGSEALPTREGTFAVTWKKKDVISNLYHTPMPYSMFFSGGQAIHYSSNFARLGYNGSSHGCVNVRDWNGLVRLYEAAPVGTKVVIHW